MGGEPIGGLGPVEELKVGGHVGEEGVLEVKGRGRGCVGAVGVEEGDDVLGAVDAGGGLGEQHGGALVLDGELVLQRGVGAQREAHEERARLLVLLELAEQRGHLLAVVGAQLRVGLLQLLLVLGVRAAGLLQRLGGARLQLVDVRRLGLGVRFGAQVGAGTLVGLLGLGYVVGLGAVEVGDGVGVLLGEALALADQHVLLALVLFGEDGDGRGDLVDQARGKVGVLGGARLDLGKDQIPGVPVGAHLVCGAFIRCVALHQLHQGIRKLLLK